MTGTKRFMTLCAVCAMCATPALAIAANNNISGPEQTRLLSKVLDDMETPSAVPTMTTVPEVVIVVRNPTRKSNSRQPVRSCTNQTTEFYGTNVRVCDVPRTPNGKDGVWHPTTKPAHLAPRDLPSPTGLLQ